MTRNPSLTVSAAQLSATGIRATLLIASGVRRNREEAGHSPSGESSD